MKPGKQSNDTDLAPGRQPDSQPNRCEQRQENGDAAARCRIELWIDEGVQQGGETNENDNQRCR